MAADVETFVRYQTADGVIVGACHCPVGSPPTPGAGEAVLTAPFMTPLPTVDTHKVTLGSPDVLTAKTAAEQDAELKAKQKESLREAIATLESCRDKYLVETPPWATTGLDAKIADLRAHHDSLP